MKLYGKLSKTPIPTLNPKRGDVLENNESYKYYQLYALY